MIEDVLTRKLWYVVGKLAWRPIPCGAGNDTQIWGLSKDRRTRPQTLPPAHLPVYTSQTPVHIELGAFM